MSDHPSPESRPTRSARTRAAATALAVLAAITLTISGPVAADATVHGGSVTARYKPGPPPVWCGTVRFCPYGVGA